MNCRCLFASLSLTLLATIAGAQSPATKKSKAPPAKAAPAPDATEAELRKIMVEDDTALDQIEQWTIQAQNADGPTAPAVRAALQLKINARIEEIRKRYDDFLTRHPKHAPAHLAFGSFLCEHGFEKEGVKSWETALELDTKNPAAWNNLANHYAHRGPVRKSFDYHLKAIELSPAQSVYHYNFGTTVFLFRKDAMEHFSLDEQQVFDKALDHYARAQTLDPQNFTLASDIAQTYYGIRPPRNEAALAAWERAFKLAPAEPERQAIHLHFARIRINMGRFDEARADLAKVTHTNHQVVRARVQKTLDDRQKKDAAPPQTVKEPK
ncbi:MAG: hypothetical protein FJ386_01485 [Verrucomicrobia bacterium]|nr:hypothetical protein [Verrucomicrobiota bacterium]